MCAIAASPPRRRQVNEPSIIHLLRTRFMKDKIYTWVGNILVAVNPFKQLELYVSGAALF